MWKCVYVKCMDVRWTLIAQRYDEKYLILHKNCLDKFGIKCEIKFLYFRHHSRSHYNQIVWKWSLSSVFQIFHSQKYSSIELRVALIEIGHWLKIYLIGFNFDKDWDYGVSKYAYCFLIDHRKCFVICIKTLAFVSLKCVYVCG